MEARINSYILTSKGIKIVSLFGYSTKGIPGIDIIGMGRLSRSLKEKIIYLTKMRELYLKKRRYVISIDINDLDGDEKWEDLKGLEFPTILLYWYLGGLLPIRKLDDCICQGFISTKGVIYQNHLPKKLDNLLKRYHNDSDFYNIKAITSSSTMDSSLFKIDTSALLSHIPKLSYRVIK
ncbi:MAG: hypothetical protein N4A33_07470 [Bacteriovoracaceae bacterium]|jgi:hypothetical protein|nr:hypothetical protein [Bacteriovoracaceae bacterium]